MKWLILIIPLLLLVSSTDMKPIKLPKELHEISGWTFVNDTTLIAHNDGGNESCIYVLSLDGKIRHKSYIKNTKNIDFEDITYDNDGSVFVGDFGNNTNTRKDLAVYKLNLHEILYNDSCTAEAIRFTYPNQKEFPPKLAGKYFDCESMAYYNDSLYLFTKCRTEPFDGRCYVYALPTKAGNYTARKIQYFIIGNRDWFRDAATSCAIYNNKLVLLTYNRYIVYAFKPGEIYYDYHKTLLPITQKEAIAVSKKGMVYIADEHNKLLGGGKMYKYPLAKKK